MPEFDADYDGSPGEGEELVDWLLAREGEAVHLDLGFTDEPASPDSPPLWECTNLPAGVEPSTQHCMAWVLYVVDEDAPDESPFPYMRGAYHLQGYFLVTGPSQTHQGYTSIRLDRVSAEAALG